MRIFGEGNPLKGLDEYNLRLADAYYSGCEPKQIEPDSEHHSGDYNCNNCEDQECEYWADYNGVQVENTDDEYHYPIIFISRKEQELKQAKGKAKRKIRRQLKRAQANANKHNKQNGSINYEQE